MVLVYVAREPKRPGMFVADLPDHPGCTAYGSTAGAAVEKALEELELRCDEEEVAAEFGPEWRRDRAACKRFLQLRMQRRRPTWVGRLLAWVRR